MLKCYIKKTGEAVYLLGLRPMNGAKRAMQAACLADYALHLNDGPHTANSHSTIIYLPWNSLEVAADNDGIDWESVTHQGTTRETLLAEYQEKREQREKTKAERERKAMIEKEQDERVRAAAEAAEEEIRKIEQESIPSCSGAVPQTPDPAMPLSARPTKW